MIKKILFVLLAIGILFNIENFSQTKGGLVIVGGVQVKSIMKKFVELAGGSKAKIIIIPNAGSYPVESSLETSGGIQRVGCIFSDYLLFTRETADADSNLKSLMKRLRYFFLAAIRVILHEICWERNFFRKFLISTIRAD